MTVQVPAPHDPAVLPAVLAARGIRKSFSGVEVLHGVDFTLRRGEVHGLVGQNGAGKSTLVKIIDGAYTSDEGEIVVNGDPLARAGAGESRRRGIAMVFQEFSLIPAMPVGQNILLSREPKGRLGLIDDGETRRRAAAALARVGADIDPDRLVEDLPVGSRQLVEIAKAISQDASIVILDEPTASLAAAEIRALTEAIRLLTAEGISVIYISHHLDEVVGICDRVTVLRDGSVTLVAEAGEVTLSTIIESMLGRSLESALTYQPHGIDRNGKPLLRISGLRNDRLQDISFDLFRGEIVGVAGLLGSGRSELMRAIFGVDHIDAGTIDIDGRTAGIRSPGDALAAGIALVPEDRGRAGLVLEHSVGHNILMAAWRRFSRAGFINDRAARQSAEQFVEQLNIRTTGLDQEVKGLSGGNQQKVVVAKNLSVKPAVLLLDDPTVGVDVGSKREILLEVRELAARGNGILLVSSEFEELSGVADRVLVIRDGAIVRVLDRSAGDDLSEAALSRVVQEQEVRPGEEPPTGGMGVTEEVSERAMADELMEPRRIQGKLVRSYRTRFPLDEDPISEGGMWVNGLTDGIDWADVVADNGVGHGGKVRMAIAERRAEQGDAVDAPIGDYDDPTAVLTGLWGRKQHARATVFSRNQTEKYYQEVELRLRSTITPNSCTGYEVFWRCLKTEDAYAEIVRWDGKIGSWKSLARGVGPEFGVKHGDVVEATITGRDIRSYINGVEVLSATDDVYAEGSPGVGFNFGCADTYVDHGFTSFEVDTFDD